MGVGLSVGVGVGVRLGDGVGEYCTCAETVNERSRVRKIPLASLQEIEIL